MKIVFASTIEQNLEIERLLVHLRESILPQYMSDFELQKYNQLGLLQLPESENHYKGTLKEAFCILSALQTIHVILAELSRNKCIAEEYRSLFERNGDILKEHGILFPFTIDFFYKKNLKAELISSYYNIDVHHVM